MFQRSVVEAQTKACDKGQMGQAEPSMPWHRTKCLVHFSFSLSFLFNYYEAKLPCIVFLSTNDLFELQYSHLGELVAENSDKKG